MASLYNLRPQFGVTVRNTVISPLRRVLPTSTETTDLLRPYARYLPVSVEASRLPGPHQPDPQFQPPRQARHRRYRPGVILSVWGNGRARVNKLIASGYNQSDQRLVNDILSGKVAKDIETIAWESFGAAGATVRSISTVSAALASILWRFSHVSSTTPLRLRQHSQVHQTPRCGPDDEHVRSRHLHEHQLCSANLNHRTRAPMMTSAGRR